MCKNCLYLRVTARIGLLVVLLCSSLSASASMITLELDPRDRTFVTLNGIVGPGDLWFSTGGVIITTSAYQAPLHIQLNQKASSLFGLYYQYNVVKCPSDDMFCAVPDYNKSLSDDDGGPSVREYCANVAPGIAKDSWIQYANSMTGKPVPLAGGSTPKPPSVVNKVSFGCTANNILNTVRQPVRMHVLLNSPGSIAIVDPSTAPPNASFCTFTSLPAISFVASGFDVTGSRRTETLHIQCTEGVPQNYTIRLLATSTTTSGGRLLFDSGVSAQISLNGQNLEANGEKLIFPNLTSTDILLAAELVGSSSDLGVSSAAGVLILEIQ